MDSSAHAACPRGTVGAPHAAIHTEDERMTDRDRDDANDRGRLPEQDNDDFPTAGGDTGTRNDTLA